MADLDRLLVDGDLDGLLRLVDETCDAADWEALERVAALPAPIASLSATVRL